MSRPSSPLARNAIEIPARPENRSSTTENERHADNCEDQRIAYNTGRGVKVYCIIATSLSVILCIGLIAHGCYTIITNRDTKSAELNILSVHLEIINLAISAIMSLCIEGMKLTHSVSLRWALLDKGHLGYNTNLRLCTTGSSFTNRWYGSLVLKTTAVLAYSSSSALVLQLLDSTPENSLQAVSSGMAEVVTGLALGVQAVFAILSLASNSRSIPTWSSNPLNTTLAAIKNGNIIPVSVHQQHQRPSRTTENQTTMIRERPTLRYALMAMWSLSVIATICTIAIAIIFASVNHEFPSCWRFTFDWNLDIKPCSRNIVYLANVYSQTAKPSSNVIRLFLLGTLFQGVQDIALHCFDLTVNVSKDERAWKQARGKTTGNRCAKKSLGEIMFNPMSITSFIVKTALHWAITQGLSLTYAIVETPVDGKAVFAHFLVIHYPRLMIYTGLSIICCSFATYLAMRPSKSQQRASFGHLQTIADIICNEMEIDRNDRETDGDDREMDGNDRETDQNDREADHSGRETDGKNMETDSTNGLRQSDALGDPDVDRDNDDETVVDARAIKPSSSNKLVPPTASCQEDDDWLCFINSKGAYVFFKPCEIRE